jgi:DNA modification methylase
MLQVVEAPVAELVLNERNPRRMREERWPAFLRSLEASRRLLEFRPVIADRKTKKVIAGNHRAEGAIRLNWSTIPVVFVDDVDELEAAVWGLLDNNQFADDDEDLVAELLAELRERGVDLELTGFERSETDALLRRLALREKDPDAVLSVPDGEPDSRPGAVYELGVNRLMCGDATDPAQVAELLAGREPRLLVTDPPYGVELDNSWREGAGLNGRRSRPEHSATTLACDDRADWSEAYALVPSLQVGYVWHASRHACEVQAGLERCGFEVKQTLIWDKGAFVLSRSRYNWQHEPCFYATRAGVSVPWFGPRNQSTVWQAPSPKMVAVRSSDPADARANHPSQKPALLFRRPIENHLSPGEALYEPFAGSGTAIVAAELTGRVCLAMELDPRCCDLIRARYREFTGEQ